MEQLKKSLMILAKLAMDERISDEQKRAIAFVAGYAIGPDSELDEAFSKALAEEAAND